MMSGSCTSYDPSKDDYEEFYRECVEGSQWVSDQGRLEGMIEEAGACWREAESWGVKFVKEDGRYVYFPGVGHSRPRNIIMVDGGFQLMSVVRGEVLRRGVRVVERVMAYRLLTSDGESPTGGRVIGAAGVNIRNGTFYVFKAKATVIATGCMSSISHKSNAASLSGDGNAMAFEVGCEFRNMDLSHFSYYPMGLNSAPGANIINSGGSKLRDIENPSMVPFPDTSLMADMSISAHVNPIPMPSASKIESTTGLLQANASALPRTIQFTTIKGTKTPRFPNRFVSWCLRGNPLVLCASPPLR